MESRLRSSRGIADVPLIELSRNLSCAASASWIYNTTASGYNLKGTNRTMSDYVVPRFHERRKKGEVFFNPMRIEKVTVNAYGTGYEIQTVANTCSSPVKKGGYKSDGEYGSVWTPRNLPEVGTGHRYPVEAVNFSPSDVSRMATEVSTEVLSQRGRSDTDIWEALAEYDRTLTMLNGPLIELRRLVSNLYKSSTPGSRSRLLLKEISGGYLLYRYGILPLLRDIENIMSSLGKMTGNQRKTTRAFERINSTRVYNGTTTVGVITGNWTNQVTETTSIRGMSLDETFVSILNNMGFSLKSLITLPYELVTLSFVADWFANIGNLLGSIAPSFGYKPLGSCLVTHTVLVNNYVITSSFCNSAAYTMPLAPTGGIAIVRESTIRGPLAPTGLVINTDFGFDKFTRTADAFALLGAMLIKTKVNIGPQPNHSAFRNKKAYQLWRSAEAY